MTRAMHIGTGVMALGTAFLLAGAFPVDGGKQTAVFHSPAFIAVCVALCLLLLLCCWQRRRAWRQIGFHLCHLGVVLALAGAVIDHFRSVSGEVQLPVGASFEATRMPGPGGVPVMFGFGIAATNFHVILYPPDYILFKKNQERLVRGDTYRVAADGTVAAGPYGRVSADRLRNADGTWAEMVMVADGVALRKSGQTPRSFEAVLRITSHGRPDRYERLAVNHPVAAHGWRFYLVSYDDEPALHVVLNARWAPGRACAMAGIWLLIAGTPLLCFRGRAAGEVGDAC